MNKNTVIKNKAKWLHYCLEIGFIEKSQLDELSAIWDKYKDEFGYIKPQPIKEDAPINSEKWENKFKEANQFIRDLAKAFGDDGLGYDDLSWSIDDFIEAAKKLKTNTPIEAIEFAEWKEDDYNYDGKNDKGEMLFVSRKTGRFFTLPQLYQIFKTQKP